MPGATDMLSKHARIRSARRLLVLFGDQLDRSLPLLGELDKERDAIFMAEVREEAEHVPSHRQRTALFLAAMRHFALEAIDAGHRVRYVRLDDERSTGTLKGEIAHALETLSPESVVAVQPGEHRVEKDLRAACGKNDVPLEIEPDASFTCSLEEFDAWAKGRKSLVMEYFYRERRAALDVLMAGPKQPEGGRWNYDDENRESFKRAPDVPREYRPRPDAVTREVMALVESAFPDAPGRMEHLLWPVTPREARRALDDFVENRLPQFGRYEDAMWAGEPVLYHSRLAAALNLKLIDPKTCVEAAVAAYESGHAPLNSVEGFVRQIIGWREFIRGVYYREGPGYADRNELGQKGALPELFWTGETDMACLSHCVGEVLDNAWGHHIPRLMVIGNFALIAGVDPRAVHEWFLGMYVDAVEWVTAPNVVGMSQHADGGIVGTKPYAGSGKYVSRMSNYCSDCRYDVTKRTGEDACPFNVFYWDFLARHRRRFEKNHRMKMVLKNLDRFGDDRLAEIRRDAERLRDEIGVGNHG